MAALAIAVAPAWAAQLEAPAALREKVRPFLMKPLPSVETIVGIAMPPPAPMLVVASFGDDKTLPDTDRGYAVGRTLNELLFGAHRGLDVENPTYYAFDTSDPGVTIGFARDSRANAYRVARREVAQWCVHGRVEGHRPALIDVVVDRCSANVGARGKRFEVAADADWPNALDELCRFVVESTGVADAHLAAPACGRAKALRAASVVAYGRYAASGAMTTERLEALVAEHPSFAPAVVDLLWRMPYDGDWRAFVERRKRLVAGAGATPAVIHTALGRHLAIYGWKIDPEIYEPMYAFIRAHPQLRSGWLLLASTLAEGRVVDHRPPGDTREGYPPNEATHTAAIAISLAYYANWPTSYRARWQMGYALLQYAFMLRGETYWNKVPLLGKAALRPLMALADPLTAEALAVQQNGGSLWANRITTAYHTDGDWRAVFDAGIARLPRERKVYETAMRYSSPQWSGKPADAERVESLARKNNPGADWVNDLRERHRPKEEASIR